MVKKISTYSLKIIVGRKESPIPIVNDIYLHSLYDPIKEADSFIAKNGDKIFGKNHFLILGLGFAYHVNRLALELKNRCSDKWSIVVIEPNARVFEECCRRNLIVDKKQVEIFKGMEVEDVYAEKKLIDFMMLKPIVLVHEASYNLYQDYYKKFLNYRAGTTAKEISDRVDDESIQKYILNYGNRDVFSLKEIVQDKASLTKEEMLMGAFFSICEDAEL